ncbi:hypothetical protein O6H91_12G039300 [Diphasiastrum complanatum]|uniref:Uncharacterized protein n=1 Tax=Diphasiastrum complanatum TaxID=34168 RepID=A0ACC2C0N0_DIPCM|nr:hypothetical protein O6H91_12G039300 [Diphasiastrum complanatum]
MAGQLEPARILLPYLQRANELQKHDPLVAYYCRLYAMEKGLKIPAKERTKATNALLVSLMNQLEKDKRVVKLSTDDHLYVEGFALNVFAKADKQDRAGHADLITAKTFYAASLFFEVLHQFGEMQPDIEQKQKYSEWKAADIRKALSEGRKPQPGPPVGDQDLSATEGMIWDMESSPQKGDTSIGAEVLHSDSSSDRITRSVSMKADMGPGTSVTEASPLARSSSYDSLDLPQAPSQSLYLPNHSSVVTAADPSFYTTAYPAECGPSVYPLSSQLDSSALPSTAESPYSHHLSTASHDMQAPLNSSYHSQQNIPPTPTPSSYLPGYATAATSYYPSSLQSSVPGAVNSSCYGSAYASSAPIYPTSGAYVSSSMNQAAAGYPETSQHHQVASASSIPADFSENGAYQANYQPSPAKVVEAHKASRFAVSALAFDDVPTAIAYLKRSLELLTSPSATI